MAIRTRTVSTAKAEGGDPKVEDYLDSKGVTWTFRKGVSVEEFDQDKSLHNQARFEPINEERVVQYADAMRRGDKFPPVIAHGSRKLITADGNHRLMAAVKTRKTLDVYDITGTPSQLLVQISYEANTKHGLPTSVEERLAQALHLMDNGATLHTAAAALNVPRGQLERASRKRSTDERFRTLGISPVVVEKLAETTKWRLGMVSTDEGFVALTDLVAKAHLGTDVVFELVTAINEIKSSAKQVAFVESQKAVYADEMAATGGGVLTRGARGPKARLAIALGVVANLPDDNDTIVKSYQGPEREEAAKRFRSAARRFNDIAKQLSA